ncbi:MAG: OmpA family protein [Bacteroidales bacterium]|nr:OmpA family protein [Bacteroidales bacterium]
MKTLKFIGAAMAALLVSSAAFAQENGNRDENGNIVRGAYETNGFWDNWFIGAGAGVNGNYDGEIKNKVAGGFAGEIFVGKWITPCVGADVKFHGLTNKAERKSPSEDVKFHQNSFEANALWNISNELSGYKETRLIDVILYAGPGVGDYNIKGTAAAWELSAQAGIIADVRLGKRIDLYANLCGRVLDDEVLKSTGRGCVLPSLTAGLVCNLGKTGFSRHSSVTPVVVPVPFTVEQYNDLSDKVAALEKENEALRAKIAELEAEPDTVFVESPIVSSATLYFDCGSATLSSRELAHLEYYASSALNADSKVTVTGSADSATGSAKRNQYLSEARANYVAKLLVEKYGLAEDNITIVADGDTNNVFDTPAKNRVVTIK